MLCFQGFYPSYYNRQSRYMHTSSAAPELFEVSDAEDASSSPKLESDIYSFGCIAYQVLSGKRAYCNIRSDNRVGVAILKGVKPKHPDIAVIEDYQWNFIEQCWAELSQ
ncbi:hypothetical protein EV424DRAFT_1558607 [Suillus variegatus]|nr:hypothetical protein EV424DRAFT_1558607 [Suillus variegatus]